MLAAVPDPPADDDPAEVGPSLWEEFSEQAAGPLVLELPAPGRRGRVDEWVLHAPARDGVCGLDHQPRTQDAIADLIGDNDVADEVLDALDPLDWSRTLDVLDDIRDHFALGALPVGLWTHLVEQIDCYGDDIDADLFDRGHDLLDWFRGYRPWQQLARLLARLPEGSRYMAAVLDDEDLAAERISSGVERPAGRKRPALLGETQDRMLRRATVSALMRVEHAVYAVNAPKGKAGRPPRPLPGPDTAEDRLRDRIADQEVEELFDDLTPGWRAGPRNAAPAGFSERPSGLLTPDT